MQEFTEKQGESQVSVKISGEITPYYTFCLNPFCRYKSFFLSTFLFSVPSLGTFRTFQLERHHVAKTFAFPLLQLL